MQTGRILKTALAVGVIANIYDYATNTFLFPNMGPQPAFLEDMATMPIQWLVICDFVAALVLVWFFDKVRVAFGPGAKGGAEYGLSAGILMNFPLWITMSLVIKDFSYVDGWFWVLFGVLWTVIMGTVAGFVYDKTGTKA